MLRLCVAFGLALGSLAPSAAFAADRVEDVVASMPENIRAEARWSRAERDKTNALWARDFIRAAGAQGDASGDAGHPSRSHQAESPR
jgi:hypothetical protein